jgi:hypothetical protein
MARLFTAASSQYLSKVVPAVWATTFDYPFTFACWAYFTTVAATQIIMMVDSTTASSRYASIYMNASTPNIVAGVNGSTYNEALSGATVTTGVWYHIASVGVSSTSRLVYLNGVSGSQTGANTLAATTINKLTIGAAFAGSATASNFTNGRIAFPAYWNAALNASDIGALKAGASPRMIKTANLVAYLRLTGNASPEPDLVSATPWTVTGTPAETANPLIFAP